jgi:hypothetical protein
MNKCKIMIWEREFELSVTYECYPGETVLDNQTEALAIFSAMASAIEESKKDVESYIMNENPTEVGKSIDNIFKYVMPVGIFVPRNIKSRSVAIMCNYKFDPEHGLAIVFENELFKAVGTQDIIL